MTLFFSLATLLLSVAVVAIRLASQRIYDEAGNVIATHEHKDDFKEW